MTAPATRTEEYLQNTPLTDAEKKVFYEVLQTLQDSQSMEIDSENNTRAIYYLHVDEDLNVIKNNQKAEDDMLSAYMKLPASCTEDTLYDWELDNNSDYFDFLDAVLYITGELLERREARKKEDF